LEPINPTSIGHQWWYGDEADIQFDDQAVQPALENVAHPVFVMEVAGRMGVTQSGTATFGQVAPDQERTQPLVGFSPALLPQHLGDTSFMRDHGLKYAYIVGAMANGITSVDMVKAAGKAGMIGFFGAGGLSLDDVENAIDQLQSSGEDYPFGINLIHSPNDLQLETAIVDLYINKEIRLVSASAYLGLTQALVYYRVHGIHQRSDGRIICPNRVIAKVSREEVARKFFSPPPDAMLNKLVQQGKITEHQARLARKVPMAQDMTAEADSGGHTDNRPSMALLPTFQAIRDECINQFEYEMPLRIGMAGGIATPIAAAAAFAMGAAYVLTGSINQSCIEAGTSEAVRKMLCQAQQADVIMAPAADMFELGAKVQVLKRGTMFAMRGTKLYDLYRTHKDYYEIPEKIRAGIERDILRETFEQAWENTCVYFQQCDPQQIQRAEKDPKYKMALVFRSYLGKASLWAKNGESSRTIDYQIWCGPAMGAFNAWAKDSHLETPDERKTAVLGLNLMYGAAVFTRSHWLRSQGVPVSNVSLAPLTVEEIMKRISE
jgi:PfaD family protein